MPLKHTVEILAKVRDSKSGTLADILREIYPGQGGRIPTQTEAMLVGASLAGLVACDLITISENSLNDVGDEMLRKHVQGNGYEVSNLLRERGENNIKVKITDNFAKLHELIGFSLSGIIADRFGVNTIKVTPFWGVPNKDSYLKSDVFVLMPFKSDLEQIYNYPINLACKNANLSCKRADEFSGSNQIIGDIWSAIFLSKIIIADCTGHNPNVFYEIGMAHTIGKPIILITQDKEDVPFDIQPIRLIKYKCTPQGMKQLEQKLTSWLRKFE